MPGSCTGRPNGSAGTADVNCRAWPGEKRPAEGGDKQRHQNRHQGLGPPENISGLKIRAPGLLGGHDLIRLLDESGDKPQGNGHHHAQLMDGRLDLLQKAQQRLQSVRQGDGAGGIGQQEGPHYEHHNAQQHLHRRNQALPGDVPQQPHIAHGRALGKKQVHNGCENNYDDNGLESLG